MESTTANSGFVASDAIANKNAARLNSNFIV
jgi:hypothetical protein